MHSVHASEAIPKLLTTIAVAGGEVELIGPKYERVTKRWTCWRCRRMGYQTLHVIRMSLHNFSTQMNRIVTSLQARTRQKSFTRIIR